MTYWHSVMHDDVALIMSEGWMDAAMPRKAIEDKDRKISETPDLVIKSGRSTHKYKMDLIRPALVVARFLVAEQADVDDLTLAADDATRVVEEYVGEHAVEDGLLTDAMEDSKINKVLVSARLKTAELEGADPEEIDALRHLLTLYKIEITARKLANDAQAALDLSTLRKYGDLTMPEIKTLVLADKWHASVADRSLGEVTDLAQVLVDRSQRLGQRYADTVEVLGAELSRLGTRFAGHLAAMGVHP